MDAVVFFVNKVSFKFCKINTSVSGCLVISAFKMNVCLLSSLSALTLVRVKPSRFTGKLPHCFLSISCFKLPFAVNPTEKLVVCRLLPVMLTVWFPSVLWIHLLICALSLVKCRTSEAQIFVVVMLFVCLGPPHLWLIPRYILHIREYWKCHMALRYYSALPQTSFWRAWRDSLTCQFF